MMKNLIAICITFLVSHAFYNPVYGQNPADQNAKDATKEVSKKEILAHYQKYDINDVRNIVKEMPDHLPTAIGRLQNMLGAFYKDHPARPFDVEDLNLNSSLKNQQNPDYKLDVNRQTSLKKLREKQAPGLIKNAPNIFELHLAMARGLRDAEKKGIVFTKNPLLSSYHFVTALRYRTLKLTPEVWTDQDRLNLLKNDNEKVDAENYIKALTGLNNARLEYEQTKRSLYTQEDNQALQAKDPGDNPGYKPNQKTLSDLKNKIKLLEQAMEKQTAIYETCAKSWNRESAGVLLELAGVVNSIDDTIRDREKILNSAVYYRSNYDGTFKQNWQLESRKSAWINLLETASLLDPENSQTPAMLAREYKSTGDDVSAISSYEKSLFYNQNATNKLTREQLVSIYRDLGGLNYNTRRYVDSAWYYEQTFALDKNEELEFQLAKIHAENTGNYDRAVELFEDLNSKIPKTDNNQNPEKIAEALKYAYTINSYLAFLYEKQNEKTDREKLTLDTFKKSADLHSQFENLVLKNYDLLRSREKIMVESRLKFNREPDENNMQFFYNAQQIYRDQKSIVQRIESMRKSINFQKTYFSLARHHEQNHDIQSAIDAYRVAESFGLSPDEARREILRLQKKYSN